MNLRDRWWLMLTMSTVVLSPLLVILGVVVSMSNANFIDPYWLDLSAKSTVSVLFLAPGFAALAAWDAAMWRNLMPAAARSWGAILIRTIAYVAVATSLTFVITLLALYFQVSPTVGAPRLDVLALGVVVVTGYAALGFLMGRFLSRLIAAPLAFGTVWAWVAYTPAVEPFWMRNVTGNLGTSCCSLDFELVPLALVAPALLAVTLLCCTLILLAWSARRVAWLCCAGALAAALFASALMMPGVGADPVQKRTGEQTCRQVEARQFCAWPEQAAALSAATPRLNETAQRLEGAGLQLPATLRENQKSPDGWSFSLGANSPEVWGQTLAVSPLDELPPPCSNRNKGVWPAGEYLPLAGAWLASVGGMRASEAADSQGPHCRSCSVGAPKTHKRNCNGLARRVGDANL
ncbi:MAG: hypothetical protein WAW88_05105 [Nocardioides sp.]